MKMEPFVPLAFFPFFYSHSWSDLRPIRDEANRGLVGFSLILQALRLFMGPGTPNSPFVLFDPQNGAFYTPKNNFDATKAIKLGKKHQRTNGSIFTHVPPPPYMREIGNNLANWRSAGKLRTFWVQCGYFQHFHTINIRQDVLRAREVMAHSFSLS